MDEDYEVEEPQPVPELTALFKSHALLNPRLFYLQRDQDISGVSGTGRVADGVLWPDGSVCVCWRSETSSISVWSSFADMVKVHGHNGATRIVFSGEPELHRALGEGIAEAERGETKHLGSFARYLDASNDLDGGE